MRGTTYLPIYAIRNHYFHLNEVLEMSNCLDFKRFSLYLNQFWGVMSVAFLRPLPPPMHAAFILIYNCSFFLYLFMCMYY
jgi:hypothetical protein